MNALVIPTNSAPRLAEFLTAWSPWPWDRIIVVQDGPEAALDIPDALADIAAERLECHSWAEIDAALDDPSIISRQDSAIRSYGFWRAWQQDAEIVFTLDDDCFPLTPGFVERHRDNLYRTPAWQSSVPGMRVRGLPYRHQGILRDVQVSVGLWRGIPDVDAVTTLAAPAALPSIGEVHTRVMAPAQYFPMSGMNLAFRRDVACLMYFPPMGLGRPFRRFDDIWAGLVVQRICRHLGMSITCGEPVVDHRRASDPFVNLAKEAPGIGVNETLWETIDAVELTAADPAGCMTELGTALAAMDDEYLSEWGRCVLGWIALFTRAAHPAADTPAEAP